GTNTGKRHPGVQVLRLGCCRIADLLDRQRAERATDLVRPRREAIGNGWLSRTVARRCTGAGWATRCRLGGGCRELHPVAFGWNAGHVVAPDVRWTARPESRVFPRWRSRRFLHRSWPRRPLPKTG